jgi:hypothetical protein
VSIQFKPIESFFSDDDKAILANTAKLNANGKALRAKRDALTARIDKGETPTGPDIKARIASLIDGKPVAEVASLEAQRLEVLYAIRDNEDALDYLAGKEKTFRAEAGRKMVLDQKTQIVAAEKAIFEKFGELYQTFVPVWQAKRELLNNSIGTYGLFNNDFDEIMGVPTDINAPWADLFRQGVAARHISKMPAALTPRKS